MQFLLLWWTRVLGLFTAGSSWNFRKWTFQPLEELCSEQSWLSATILFHTCRVHALSEVPGNFCSDTTVSFRRLPIVPAAYPEQESVRNVRAHREMVIHIERHGFIVLGRIVTDDSRSKISRFSRNMPAYESMLSGFKTKIRHADFTTKHNDYAHHLIIQFELYCFRSMYGSDSRIHRFSIKISS